ncbi:MAG: hypothetical protein CVT60_07440 [Actinobacteria bacterium HGW-Actinobacteria-10]|nr:MAG: hypothetical protein CVT60_07440 [Actinobacteria bacterium HGW-Actinobacteria-10]
MRTHRDAARAAVDAKECFERIQVARCHLGVHAQAACDVHGRVFTHPQGGAAGDPHGRGPRLGIQGRGDGPEAYEVVRGDALEADGKGGVGVKQRHGTQCPALAPPAP